MQKIETHYFRKPIPDRRFDWIATFADYDGAPDAGPQLIGCGETEELAIDDLVMQWEDAQ